MALRGYLGSSCVNTGSFRSCPHLLSSRAPADPERQAGVERRSLAQHDSEYGTKVKTESSDRSHGPTRTSRCYPATRMEPFNRKQPQERLSGATPRIAVTALASPVFARSVVSAVDPLARINHCKNSEPARHAMWRVKVSIQCHNTMSNQMRTSSQRPTAHTARCWGIHVAGGED